MKNTTVKGLIKQLQKLPMGAKVFVFDHKLNLADDSGDGSSEGIYQFEVSFMGKDSIQKGTKPFVVLSFDNPEINFD